MRTMLIAALIGACTGPEGKEDDGDDTDPPTDTEIDGETDVDTTPDDSGDGPGSVYTVTGSVASVPYGTDEAGRPPWTILLMPAIGSLVVGDGDRTYIQCLTFECGELRPITDAEYRCRLGDQRDPFAREICQLVGVVP